MGWLDRFDREKELGLVERMIFELRRLGTFGRVTEYEVNSMRTSRK